MNIQNRLLPPLILLKYAATISATNELIRSKPGICVPVPSDADNGGGGKVDEAFAYFTSCDRTKKAPPHSRTCNEFSFNSVSPNSEGIMPVAPIVFG